MLDIKFKQHLLSVSLVRCSVFKLTLLLTGGVFRTRIHFDRSVDPLMTIYPPRDFLTFPKYV